jgi:hypothetical protein
VLDMENFLEGWPLAAPPLAGYRLWALPGRNPWAMG